MTIIKKTTTVLLLCALYNVMAYAHQNKPFIIQGTVESLKQGEVVLWMETSEGNDTICIAPIINECFHVKGNIAQSQMACISVKGYDGFILFVLSPDATYTIDLKKNDAGSVQSDAPLQSEFNRYLSLVSHYNNRMRDLRASIAEATSAQKFRTASQLRGELQRLSEEAVLKTDSIVVRNGENILGVYLRTTRFTDDTPVELLQQCFDNLSTAARKTEPAKILAQRISMLNNLAVGAKAPDFSLPDKDGAFHSLYNVDADIIIIDFWASWCGPCRKENPAMAKLYRTNKTKGLQIIGISLDDDMQKWQNAVIADNLTWLQLLAQDTWQNPTIKRYGVKNVPSIFVLDKNKRIIAKNLRQEELRKFVEDTLNK